MRSRLGRPRIYEAVETDPSSGFPHPTFAANPPEVVFDRGMITMERKWDKRVVIYYLE